MLASCHNPYNITICCYQMATELLTMIGALVADGLGIVVVTTGTQTAHAGVALN